MTVEAGAPARTRKSTLTPSVELTMAIAPGNIDSTINIEAVWDEVSDRIADLLMETGLLNADGVELRTAIRASRHGLTHLVLSLTKDA